MPQHLQHRLHGQQTWSIHYLTLKGLVCRYHTPKYWLNKQTNQLLFSTLSFLQAAIFQLECASFPAHLSDQSCQGLIFYIWKAYYVQTASILFAYNTIKLPRALLLLFCQTGNSPGSPQLALNSEMHLPASWELGSKVCVTMATYQTVILIKYNTSSWHFSYRKH